MLAKTRAFRLLIGGRQIGLAALVATAGCGVCCALPLFASLGLGGGALGGLLLALPGLEPWVFAGVFLLVLSLLMFLRRRRNRAGCGPACAS